MNDPHFAVRFLQSARSTDLGMHKPTEESPGRRANINNFNALII